MPKLNIEGDYLFMIGIGWKLPKEEKWNYKCLYTTEISVREEKRIWVSQKQGFVNHMVDPRFGQYTDTDKALCSVLVSYMFVADEPVWLEVYPPFLHGEVKNTRFISGTFDIHSWQRPVDFTFEILNDKKSIKIKENQPLYYVRFVSKKL